MDDDSMLPYTGSHFSSAEPVRFHGGPGFSSSAEEELSSDSSQENAMRAHALASGSGHFPIDEEEDSYGIGFPSAEDFSNTSSYGGAPPDPVPYAARLSSKNSSIEDKSVSSQTVKPLPGPIRYRECMKNHAASLGGHAVDGCGEFLACGADGFDALICSVCGCHRNFHRREVEGEHVCICKHHNVPMNINFKGVTGPPTPGLLSIPTSRDIVLHSQANLPTSPFAYADDADLLSDSLSRKRRHRTKFSSEQKERMFSFAEYLGWRIVKQNDAVVQQFCDEIGVKRSVFKVWMHNNKNNVTKRINTGETILARNYESPSDY
ncbi:hypothetical protein GOP47_0012581 [Adiantum capillus-veneris]|uniref:ZF-HD dimerization-type domain-containing protein n=1 Tax=Adiantum capillus-veneris TaxID=13818 RepID=A0A9D4ZGL4_ADICA|nr:hypothetical protein GOP47_0012581 [Adiantum capillus-veneris]